MAVPFGGGHFFCTVGSGLRGTFVRHGMTHNGQERAACVQSLHKVSEFITESGKPYDNVDKRNSHLVCQNKRKTLPSSRMPAQIAIHSPCHSSESEMAGHNYVAGDLLRCARYRAALHPSTIESVLLLLSFSVQIASIVAIH